MLSLYFAYLDDASDQRLFEDIYNAYRKQMVSLALSILGQPEDAEDAVHKVFLRVAERNWDAVRSIKCDQDLRNYLLKATKNTSLNMLETKKHTAASVDAIMEFDLAGITALSDDDFLEQVCNRAEMERIVQAINALDEKYRNALYYHFVMELTMAETAKALGQTYAATKKQLFRGKKMLLKLLGMEGVEEHGDQQG